MVSATFSRSDAVLSRGQKGWKGQKKSIALKQSRMSPDSSLESRDTRF